MYVVREKKDKKVIHINPAPLSQALEGQDVYFEFDARKMEIGKTEGPLPEFFEINEEGDILELGLEQKITAGLIELQPDQKFENGEIVDKTLAEKAADGLIKMEPGQKVEDEQIVLKTQAELLQQGLISLDEIKQQKKGFYSAMALQNRSDFLPDYKIQNALMGIYDDSIVSIYKKTIEAFREEFYRLESLVDAADSLQALEKITPEYPEALAGTLEKSTTKRNRSKSVKTVRRSRKKDD